METTDQSKSGHVSLLKTVGWLPIALRIKSKLPNQTIKDLYDLTSTQISNYISHSSAGPPLPHTCFALHFSHSELLSLSRAHLSYL